MHRSKQPYSTTSSASARNYPHCMRSIWPARSRSP